MGDDENRRCLEKRLEELNRSYYSLSEKDRAAIFPNIGLRRKALQDAINGNPQALQEVEKDRKANEEATKKLHRRARPFRWYRDDEENLT